MRPEVAVHGLPVAGRGAATRSRWLRSWVVILLAGVAAAVGCVAVLQALPGETPRPTTTARHGLTSLPLAAQGPVSASLGQDAPAYRVTGLQAVNPAQHLRTSFSRRGVTVAAGAAQLGMALSAYGYGRALRPVEPALPRASDNRVRYAHGALTEWYANGPLGIEQGFDVAARPGPAAGPLTLSLALSGSLAARLRGDSVLFTGGGVALRYGGLVATDADGQVLRSWLRLVKGHLLIRVADRGASYPLRIDPMVQQGKKLTGTGAIGTGRFGYTVALSGDGNTALIGGNYLNIGAGAAWVFTRSGSIWTQQGPKLTGGGETGEGRFGVAVALSADGDTALIGGLADNSTRGAAWLFSRSGSTWTQQGSKLTPDDGAGEGEFGTNVALSADGATGLIGAWRDNSGTGAAWAFVNPPEATTAAATNIGEVVATLNGSLAGGGSKAYFQYGTTAAYGDSTAIQSVSPSGNQSPLAAALDGLAPGTTYHFRLVAENSGGVTYGDDLTFTTEARATTAPTEPTIPPPSPPNETLPAPVVQHARQSATRWRAGNRLASISHAKAPIGTIFSFTLNEQATMTFSFARRVSGRKVSGKCVAQTEKNRRKPACSRAVPAGTLTFTAHTGANKVAFQGRISPAKKLKPGYYTVLITASNSAGMRSAPKSLSFTILR